MDPSIAGPSYGAGSSTSPPGPTAPSFDANIVSPPPPSSWLPGGGFSMPWMMGNSFSGSNPMAPQPYSGVTGEDKGVVVVRPALATNEGGGGGQDGDVEAGSELRGSPVAGGQDVSAASNQVVERTAAGAAVPPFEINFREPKMKPFRVFWFVMYTGFLVHGIYGLLHTGWLLDVGLQVFNPSAQGSSAWTWVPNSGDSFGLRRGALVSHISVIIISLALLHMLFVGKVEHRPRNPTRCVSVLARWQLLALLAMVAFASNIAGLVGNADLKYAVVKEPFGVPAEWTPFTAVAAGGACRTVTGGSEVTLCGGYLGSGDVNPSGCVSSSNHASFVLQDVGISKHCVCTWGQKMPNPGEYATAATSQKYRDGDYMAPSCPEDTPLATIHVCEEEWITDETSGCHYTYVANRTECWAQRWLARKGECKVDEAHFLQDTASTAEVLHGIGVPLCAWLIAVTFYIKTGLARKATGTVRTYDKHTMHICHCLPGFVELPGWVVAGVAGQILAFAFFVLVGVGSLVTMLLSLVLHVLTCKAVSVVKCPVAQRAVVRLACGHHHQQQQQQQQQARATGRQEGVNAEAMDE